MPLKLLLSIIIFISPICKLIAVESILLHANEQQQPKAYQENGKPAGYAIEEAKTLLEKFDVKVVIKQAPFIRSLSEVKKCQGLMTGVYYSKERAKELAYSLKPLPTSDEVVVIHGIDKNFSRVQDFVGQNISYLRGGVAFGEEFYELFKSNKFTTNESNNMENLIKMAAYDRTDYVIFTPNRQRAQQVINSLNYGKKVTIAVTPLIKHDNFLVCCKAQLEYYQRILPGVF